jgi:hypothetical protein
MDNYGIGFKLGHDEGFCAGLSFQVQDDENLIIPEWIKGKYSSIADTPEFVSGYEKGYELGYEFGESSKVGVKEINPDYYQKF